MYTDLGGLYLDCLPNARGMFGTCTEAILADMVKQGDAPVWLAYYWEDGTLVVLSID